MENFLIRPFDQLIIRRNPIYDDRIYILEQLDEDLNIYKERANYEAPSIEAFFEKVKDDQSIKDQNKKVFERLNSPGWVMILADPTSSMEELWKLAMEKVEQKDFFKKKTVSSTEDIEDLQMKLKVYINDFKSVLTVLFVEGYPNVITDINTEEELPDTWSAVEIMEKTYDINVHEFSGQLYASIYGLKIQAGQEKQSTNIHDYLDIPVEVIRNEKSKVV